MDRGAWAAARLWARGDWRSRWRLIVAAGLIAGLTSGLALACVAGARRTGSALERIREQTNASDVIVFSSQVGVSHPDWAPLAARPEVRFLAVWSLVFGDMGDESEFLVFTPVDDQWMQQVDAPVIVDGRAIDPESDDEVLVTVQVAKAEGLFVGDTLPFQPYTVDDVEGSGVSSGPELQLEIVGIVKSPVDDLFVGGGLVVGSPGMLARHPEVAYFENAFVQLTDPSLGSQLEAHAAEDIAPGTPILDFAVTARRVSATTDVQRSALLLLAGAIALAGIVLAGQVVARSAATVGRDAPVLEAVGMRRTAVAAAGVLSHLPAVVAAALTCTGTALVASQWMPFGIAGRLEPDPGIHLDPGVVLGGTALLVLILAGGTYLSAWLASRARGVDPARQGLGIVEWVRRHTSAQVGIGTTMAFGRGGGRSDLPVRPALLGAVLGVLGVASAITLDAGLQDAFDHPERAGVVWDAFVSPGGDLGVSGQDVITEQGFAPEFVAAVRGVDGIASSVQVDRSVIPVDDASGVPGWSLRDPDGDEPIQLAVLEGRAPHAPGEVALGPNTAADLGVGVGDTVAVGHDALPATVVGIALFPAEVHAAFDQGIWLTPTDYDAVADLEAEDVERGLAVRFAPGADDEGLASLTEVAAGVGGFAGPVELPPELVNLRDVRTLPRLLAAFLALLAVAALLHVLMTTARARAHEFAVLRAIGISRRGTRAIVNVHGVALFLVGLVLGLPLGLAAGRTGWRLVAERIPLEDVSPVAVEATVLIVPLALLVARVVAVAPGWRVTRLRTAETLRTE